MPRLLVLLCSYAAASGQLAQHSGSAPLARLCLALLLPADLAASPAAAAAGHTLLAGCCACQQSEQQQQQQGVQCPSDCRGLLQVAHHCEA
jgi:hypothetical protein